MPYNGLASLFLSQPCEQGTFLQTASKGFAVSARELSLSIIDFVFMHFHCLNQDLLLLNPKPLNRT